MSTFKKENVKVELFRDESKGSFVLKKYLINDPEYIEKDGTSIFYTEDRPRFFHLPLKWDDNEIVQIKKMINGHAFKGGIKNSFHAVRKEKNYNSTIKEKRGDLSKEFLKEAFTPLSEVKHKNQLIRIIKGIKFVDDSSSVNVNCAWFSLEINQGPIVWIMGGLDFRNNDYQIIFDLAKKKVKGIVFIGNQSDKADQIFGKIIPFIFHTQNMKDAVEVSYHLAEPGDTVLLSPSCSSLDLFENYEDRGNQFKKYTLSLD